jgi:hypothetical protein
MDSRLMRVDELERRVLAALETRVLTEKAFDEAVSAYEHEFVRAQGDRGATASKLEAERADTQKKLDRLLRMVEDGHADPAVAGPRLNELSAKKRDLTSQLSVRQDDAPLIAPGDSAAKYRKHVENLRLRAEDGNPEEATAIVRGLVRRVTITPSEDYEPQALEIEAGTLPVGTPADQYCNIGCGGPQQLLQYWDCIRIKA